MDPFHTRAYGKYTWILLSFPQMRGIHEANNRTRNLALRFRITYIVGIVALPLFSYV